jgi:hypothetical protein
MNILDFVIRLGAALLMGAVVAYNPAPRGFPWGTRAPQEQAMPCSPRQLRAWAISEVEGTPDAAGNAKSARFNGQVHYSRRRLRASLRDARTPEDHDRLAAYFRARANEFSAKQAHEQQVLAEYLNNPGKYPSRYPTRGDVARNLAAYYGTQAREAYARASEQERVAAQMRAGR